MPTSQTGTTQTHYQRNKAQYKAKAKKDWLENKEIRYATRMARLQHHYDWLNEYKAQRGCSKCGEDRGYVLQFHHTDPSRKEGSISSLINSTSWKNVLEEIEKCDVLCANCHMALHHKERTT